MSGGRGTSYWRAGSPDPWLHQARLDLLAGDTRPGDERPSIPGTLYGNDPNRSGSFAIARTFIDDAACKDEGDLFERAASVTGRARVVQEAKDVCAGCPVRQACLDDAMEHESGGSPYRWGVRGGLSEAERANLWAEQQPN